MSVGAYLHGPRNVDVRPRKRRRAVRRLQPVHERLEEECCGAAPRGLAAGLYIANRPSISVQEDWTGTDVLKVCVGGVYLRPVVLVDGHAPEAVILRLARGVQPFPECIGRLQW